jgi:hypothetical protein
MATSCWSATAPRSGWRPPRCSADTVETWYVPNAGLVVLRREEQGWALEAWDTGEPVRKDVTGGGAPA